ncbi:AAA family ATPase [Aliarcobacter butzleri]
MELVYLWVEKYKNIEKQGFNFSPRFRCEYDEEKNELEIIDKDETGEFYPKKFFGDNINVTAIVGENGSGKSSIFEIIKKLHNTGYISNNDYSFCIFYKNEKFFIMNNLYRHTNKEIEIKNNKYKINKVDRFNGKEILVDKEHKKEIKEYTLGRGENNYLELSSEIFYKRYKNVSKEFDKDFYFDNYIFYMNIKTINSKLLTPIELLHEEDEQLFKIKDENIDKESLLYELLNIAIYLFVRDEYKYLINKEYSEKIKKLYDEVVKIKITCFKDFKKVLEIYKSFDLLENRYYQYFSEENKIKDFFNFLRFDQKERIFKIKTKDFKEYEDVFLKNNISEFLNKLNLIELDMYQNANKSYKYSSFSSGEKYYFGFLVDFFNYNFINKSEERMIFIDELELYLHPNWQKILFDFIQKNLEKNKSNVHLIIATHSPFILSDIPKQNVIFLEKDVKTGKCVNATEKMEGFNTFGANIHTLLSHGFFMKDGLMGEFAKDKIQSIIKYHEDIEKKEVLEADKVEYKTKKQKEFWQIQSIIGDDYLKQVIKNHLVEIEKIVLGNDEAKKEEVKRLKAQIELLEK